jgi:general secretion pathway protein L
MGRLTAPWDRPVADSATGFCSGAGIGGLLAWWRRQLGAVLPGWAQRLFSARDAIIIDVWSASPDPNAALPATGQIVFRRSGRLRIAAPLDLSRPQVERAASDPIILRLPQQLILRREVTLPIAAERDLRSIIHSQMDRLTPFEATEVFWGASEHVRHENRLKLTLHVVPRSRIEWLLERLAGVGLAPSFLEEGADGIRLARLGYRKNPWKSPGAAARLGFRAALVLGCLLVPLISQQRRLQATEHRLEVLMPVQRQIMQLQAQIADQTAAQRLIRQTQRDTPLRALALLSAALPDGTWLNDFAVTGDRVSFDGQSSDAAQLILALSATPGLQDVSFITPVTRAPGGADIFSIQLAVSR